MYKEFIFKSNMRKLWTDHIVYTRQFIISSVDNLQSPDIPYIIQRLMINQEEIGDLLKPYYGEKKSLEITNLLKEHIQIAGDFVISNIKKDIELSMSIKMRWYVNAIEIAKYLHEINPKINKIIVRDMLFDHLDFTERELLARLRKDYVLDIIMFDSVYEQVIMMSDTISEGIIRQFQVRFRDDYKENLNLDPKDETIKEDISNQDLVIEKSR